jgi:hypothetical protein
VHGLLLGEAEMALVDLARRSEDKSLLLALLLTVGIAVLFVFSHVRLVRPSGIKGGAAHGAFFSLLADLLVEVNQYFLYPIPGSLAAYWLVFGFCEFCIYGLIAALLYPMGWKTVERAGKELVAPMAERPSGVPSCALTRQLSACTHR